MDEVRQINESDVHFPVRKKWTDEVDIRALVDGEREFLLLQI